MSTGPGAPFGVCSHLMACWGTHRQVTQICCVLISLEREINSLLDSLKNVPVSETEDSGKCFEKSKLVGKIKGSIYVTNAHSRNRFHDPNLSHSKAHSHLWPSNPRFQP